MFFKSWSAITQSQSAKLALMTLTTLTAVHCTTNSKRHFAPSNETLAARTFTVNASTNSNEKCAAFRAQLPSDFKQGFITYSEGEEPSTRTVKVFYYGRWKSNPLVFVNGGPGNSSWKFFDTLKESLNREPIDFLFFDQKGTGCSSPPPALLEANYPLWAKYGSDGHAVDIEQLRAKLHLGKQITVFGQSFGSKVALRYLARYPRSTRAVVIHGDSFVSDEATIVDDIADGLRHQQQFLESRLNANPKLKPLLMNLAETYTTGPCAQDETGLIKACGFDLIRDLGHYYMLSSQEKIERLLAQLNDPEQSADAFTEAVNSYAKWKLDARTFILGYLDYRHLFRNQSVCELAMARVEMPPWYLNSCATSRAQQSFLKSLQPHLSPNLLTQELVEKVLRQNPTQSVFEILSANDLLNTENVKDFNIPHWHKIPLKESDHFSYFKNPEFWSVLKQAQKSRHSI